MACAMHGCYSAVFAPIKTALRHGASGSLDFKCHLVVVVLGQCVVRSRKMKTSFANLASLSVAVGIMATLTVDAESPNPLIKHQESLIRLLEDYQSLLNATQETCSLEDKIVHLNNKIETDVLQRLNAVLRRLGDVEARELPMNATQKEYSKIEDEIQTLRNKFEKDVLQKLNDVIQRLDYLEGSWRDTRDIILHNKSTSSACEDGWLEFQGSCFFFSPGEVSWEEGREECLDMGSDYVKIPSVDVFHFLQIRVSKNTWIGLNDRIVDGMYTWISDGEVANIPKSWWHRGEPNDDHEQSEDCCHFWIHNGKTLLNDAQCHEKHNYICEKKIETSTT